MRYMARVVTVKEVFQIAGKDRIQKATFKENGYEAIISKSIQVGDAVVWIEADSILPVKPQWEFLRKRCWSDKLQGFLIKPMTMAGVKSWGLVVTFDEAGLKNEAKMLHPGDDITELLGIRKNEPIEDASPKKTKNKHSKVLNLLLSCPVTRWIGKIVLWWQKKKAQAAQRLKDFPEYIISKSDEDTIQQHPEWLEQHADEKVCVTAKMEGQSVTACFDYNTKTGRPGKFFVCSRNVAYRESDSNNDYWNYAIKNNIEQKLLDYYNRTGKLLCIQAEQCGPGVQQNIYCLDEHEWFVYSMKNEVTGRQCSFMEMQSICEELGLQTVPMIEHGVALKAIMPNLDMATRYAANRAFSVENGPNGKKVCQRGLEYVSAEKVWKSVFLNEGVVVRSLDYDKDRNIGFSFKVKNIEYAEKTLGVIHSLVYQSLR